MTREEKRNLYAERVCQELRWQLIHGFDEVLLCKYLNMWMNNTGKKKYLRPPSKAKIN